MNAHLTGCCWINWLPQLSELSWAIANELYLTVVEFNGSVLAWNGNMVFPGRSRVTTSYLHT
ncbi:MAG: hypothetical protein VKL39_09760 [Leptolyngbyaceae bacterium]|nr:hypothetical protein [Leptolyngbyaceae bacterium]